MISITSIILDTVLGIKLVFDNKRQNDKYHIYDIAYSNFVENGGCRLKVI